MKEYSSKGKLLLTAMVLLFSFLITSCEPDEPEPQRYLGKFYIGEIKNYTFFKPGSMWVYECDSKDTALSENDVDRENLLTQRPNATPWRRKTRVLSQPCLSRNFTHRCVAADQDDPRNDDARTSRFRAIAKSVKNCDKLGKLANWKLFGKNAIRGPQQYPENHRFKEQLTIHLSPPFHQTNQIKVSDRFSKLFPVPILGLFTI